MKPGDITKKDDAIVIVIVRWNKKDWIVILRA